MKINFKIFSLVFFFTNLLASITNANPIISGISTNEINIDTNFNGANILLFGAKGDSGNIVIAVRGPKKNFIITKKERFLGIWHNGERAKVKDLYSYYSLFSDFSDNTSSAEILGLLELGKNNINFNFSGENSDKKKNEFEIQLVEKFEKNKLYSAFNKIDFLDETLFKVMLHFPKSIARGTYNVEIYLINENNLTSFQSIPIYVNQVGMSARILDFAYQESFLYGIITVALALIVGWLANYLFIRFIGK
ncbi:MAG: TIGR02186 family protein [Rickettsiales bacterium]|nr:TIGR02186 family protein [Rickettsiales bacterium]